MSESNQEQSQEVNWLNYSVRYTRSEGWIVSCECGEFCERSDRFDSGMFYALGNHYRTSHPGHEEGTNDMFMTIADMKAFVDYFDHQVEKSTGAKRWVIAMGVALGIGLIPVLWAFVDWLVTTVGGG